MTGHRKAVTPGNVAAFYTFQKLNIGQSLYRSGIGNSSIPIGPRFSINTDFSLGNMNLLRYSMKSRSL